MDKKICSRCNIEKDILEFRIKKGYKDDLFCWCNDCFKEYSKQWRELKKESRKIEAKIYRKENKEKIKKYSKEYYHKNRERFIQYNEENAERIKQKKKIYTKENSIFFSIRTHKYNSRKRNLESNFTIDQWNYAKSYFDNRCAYCGEEKPLVQEHFIAVSNGGGYTKENIIPSCKSCNSSKRNFLFEEWYHNKSYYSIEREKRIYEFIKAQKE